MQKLLDTKLFDASSQCTVKNLGSAVKIVIEEVMERLKELGKIAKDTNLFEMTKVLTDSLVSLKEKNKILEIGNKELDSEMKKLTSAHGIM